VGRAASGADQRTTRENRLCDFVAPSCVYDGAGRHGEPAPNFCVLPFLPEPIHERGGPALNCLILGWRIGSGSTGVYAYELAQYLSERGHHVTCLSAGESDWRLRPISLCATGIHSRSSICAILRSCRARVPQILATKLNRRAPSPFWTKCSPVLRPTWLRFWTSPVGLRES
jgi:hypothetical protein